MTDLMELASRVGSGSRYETMAVYHHPCGKREVLLPTEARPPCAACQRIGEDALGHIAATTAAAMRAAFKPRRVIATRRAHQGAAHVEQ